MPTKRVIGPGPNRYRVSSASSAFLDFSIEDNGLGYLVDNAVKRALRKLRPKMSNINRTMESLGLLPCKVYRAVEKDLRICPLGMGVGFYEVRYRTRSSMNYLKGPDGEVILHPCDTAYERHNKKTTTPLAPVHSRSSSRSRKQKEVKVSGRQGGGRSRNQSRGGSS